MQKSNYKRKQRPAQHQKKQPGIESKMKPLPVSDNPDYIGSEKLKDKAALITGGDSGIGKAAAIAFAKEGADIGIIYYNEHADAKETKDIIESLGRKCIIVNGNIGNPAFCKSAVNKVQKRLQRLNIIVNNAAVHFPQPDITKVSTSQLLKTFSVNVFSCFYIVKAAMPYLKENASIINTTSVTAYRGSDHLIDYASTKGAIVSFTRSLSSALIDKGIRVNGVAPGPVWTPLIPASFSPKHVAVFGSDVPMKRAGQPEEIAPCFVFLASEDSKYMTGQILHPNGGEIVNG